MEKANLSLHTKIKKAFGMFFTPEHIVDFMVMLIETERLKKGGVILEPACGLAQFLSGIRRNLPWLYKKATLFGVEINEKLVDYLKKSELAKKIKFLQADYLLWESPKLFDLIIGNPPYGIPSISSHYPIKVPPQVKEKYKKEFQTWHGKYNVYGAFIEKSIRLLKEGGQLIFIVPASFMVLDEFKKLRILMATQGKTQIIYMGTQIFKPEADICTVILNFIKTRNENSLLTLSEYKNMKIYLIKKLENWQGEIITFDTPYTRKMKEICEYNVGDIYEIRISPRTSEIKSNPLIIKCETPPSHDFLPILNGRNLKQDRIIYKNLTGFWVRKKNVVKIKTFFTIPHIVVGLGFRGKGKVAAALEKKCYPWMGDVYHLIRKKTFFINRFSLTDEEVVKFLNSECVAKYIKEIYREIIYHLNITQIKSIPLPSNKEKWEAVRKLL